MPETSPSGIRHVGGATLNLGNVRTRPAMPREKDAMGRRRGNWSL